MELGLKPTKAIRSVASPLTSSVKKWVKGIHHSRSKSSLDPNIPIYFEKGNYIVKTVSEPWEFREVLKLRYDVFHKEYRKAKLPIGWDLDEFDFIADHLIIIRKPDPATGATKSSRSKRIGEVVGTYRMISSQFSEQFYSQTEFNLDAFVQSPGIKLELGRACIHMEHRKGSVMNLLWRGVSEYMRSSGARYLFGCSSVKIVETPQIASVHAYLASKNFVSSDWGVKPLPKYEVPEIVETLAGMGTSALTEEKETEVKALLPPLLEMYLMAGASVFGHPALDMAFNCIDLLTILDIEKMSPFFQRRFGRDAGDTQP